MTTLMRYFGPQVRVAGVVVVVAAVLALALARRGPRETGRRWSPPWTLLAAGVGAAVLTMTSWPAQSGRPPVPLQLVPSRTVLRQLDNPDATLAVINLAGNVAVFVPLGFCLWMAMRRRAGLAVCVGASVSVLAEAVQLATGTRVADVDDVLVNTLGVALGVWAAQVVHEVLIDPAR